jgi:hypothetical protein
MIMTPVIGAVEENDVKTNILRFCNIEKKPSLVLHKLL